MTIRYKAKKIKDGEYEFRGNYVFRNSAIKEGVLGAWFTTGGSRLEMKATSLESIMKMIDHNLDH